MFESQSSSTYHPAAASRALIVLILCIFAATACAPRQDMQTLERAEALLDSLPDSSLTVLNTIEPPRRESLRALHAFLTAKARYKAYFDDDSDSTLMVALNYYTAHPSAENEHRLMECHFLRGIILENADNTSGAIISLLKAEKIALALHDNFYLGMIYRNIAQIYIDVYCGAQHYDYATKSKEAFEAYGDPSYIAYGKVYLSHACVNTGHNEDALILANQAISDGMKLNDSTLIKIAIDVKGRASSSLNRSADVIEAYNLLETAYGQELSTQDLCLLASAYANTGNKYIADSILERIITREKDTPYLPHHLFAQAGDYKAAYDALVAHTSIYENAFNEVAAQNVTRSVADYQEMETRISQEQSKNARLIKWIVILFSFILIISGTAYHYNKLKTLAKRQKELVAEAKALSTSLLQKRTEFRLLQESLQEGFLTQFSQINDLCSTYYEYNGSPLAQKKIYEKIYAQIRHLATDKSSLTELEGKINLNLNNLMNKFRAAYPQLKDEDINLYMYLVAGFSPRTISLFITEKIEIVYNRKSRLKSKLIKYNNELSSEFIKYIN